MVSQPIEVCLGVLAERAPISAPDGRRDRLMDAISEVENFLRAKAGSW